MFRKEINPAISSKFHKKINKINYSSTQAPPNKSKKIKPKKKVVFVNPDDDRYLYWWPALVVPEVEYNLFKNKQSYDDSNNFKIPNENEILVCYFEDGSFSVIPESDSVPFNPSTLPYTKYISDPNISATFKNDKAVKLAKLYLETGELPSTFLWLKDVPSEDREKDDKSIERNKVVEDKKKKLLSNSYIQKRREKKEKEIIKKSPKIQNKSSPLVKLANIKNTQSQEFKHVKLSELKNQKSHIHNNGLKHLNKSSNESLLFEKNDNSVHHNHNIAIKNEMNRMTKSSNMSSSNLNNNINNDNNNTSTSNNNNSSTSNTTNNNINNKLETMGNKIYDSSKSSIMKNLKSQNNDSTNFDDKQEEIGSSGSSAAIRSRRVSLNRDKNKDTYSMKENDIISLPEFLTKPLILNLKKQKLPQQDESEILSIFPEPKKKRLKKTFDIIQNFVNHSVEVNKLIKNNDIYPIPPIQISDTMKNSN